MLKLNKEEFLKTELGISLSGCIKSWDEALDNQAAYPYGSEAHRSAYLNAKLCQARWEVFQMVIKQLYGVEYHFTRTDEYFGVVTEDETDWLIKVER